MSKFNKKRTHFIRRFYVVDCFFLFDSVFISFVKIFLECPEGSKMVGVLCHFPLAELLATVSAVDVLVVFEVVVFIFIEMTLGYYGRYFLCSLFGNFTPNLPSLKFTLFFFN